jgi:DNA invertase Pin-like site-specific DNA recombinase
LESRKFGYVRVSARDQNENRQIESMKETEFGDWYIFVDKQSGKKFDRENHQLMKRMIRKGDSVFFYIFSRLAIK